MLESEILHLSWLSHLKSPYYFLVCPLFHSWFYRNERQVEASFRPKSPQFESLNPLSLLLKSEMFKGEHNIFPRDKLSRFDPSTNINWGSKMVKMSDPEDLLK